MVLSAWEVKRALKYSRKTIAYLLKFQTRSANLRVSVRVCDAEGGAVCSKNSTFGCFDVTAWTPLLRSPTPIMDPNADFIHGIVPGNCVNWTVGTETFDAFFVTERHYECFNQKLWAINYFAIRIYGRSVFVRDPLRLIGPPSHYISGNSYCLYAWLIEQQ